MYSAGLTNVSPACTPPLQEHVLLESLIFPNLVIPPNVPPPVVFVLLRVHTPLYAIQTQMRYPHFALPRRLLPSDFSKRVLISLQ